MPKIYEFRYSTLLESEWKDSYFDSFQLNGWELLNIAPSPVVTNPRTFDCFWRKEKINA